MDKKLADELEEIENGLIIIRRAVETFIDRVRALRFPESQITSRPQITKKEPPKPPPKPRIQPKYRKTYQSGLCQGCRGACLNLNVLAFEKDGNATFYCGVCIDRDCCSNCSERQERR